MQGFAAAGPIASAVVQALYRFQFVATHPAWRRRGLCSALIRTVSRQGFDALGLDLRGIAAVPDDGAIGLHESLGFARNPPMGLLGRPSPTDRTTGC